MNELLDHIMVCEEAYIRCFCEVKDEGQFIRYEDPQILDMYDHQFIKLKEMVSDEALQEIVNKETKMRIEQHQPACEIKLVDAPQVIPVSYSQVAAEVEHLGIYVCNLEKVESWSVLSGCELKQIKTNEDIEDLAKLDIISDGESCGEDFCKRRASRRGKVYTADEGCDSHLLYYKEEIVARCDLFVEGETAKIEDFVVRPDAQRKGIGTTFLKVLVQKAIGRGAKIVYLVADEDDTPKEMYLKLGFNKVKDLYTLFWKL